MSAANRSPGDGPDGREAKGEVFVAGPAGGEGEVYVAGPAMSDSDRFGRPDEPEKIVGIDSEYLSGRRFPYQEDPSLLEDVDLLEATPEARSWFGPVFLDAYLRHKRAEIRSLEGLDPAAQCARYALTY